MKKFEKMRLVAKNTMTSIYSDKKNAHSDASPMRHESEKIVSYADPIRV